jgi:UDPglucose--hexose-1-phosphate uridylyltransferase
MLDLGKSPHRRYNPLTGRWVLVSPHRTDRPWQGQVEKTARAVEPDYDAGCYLCPGNARARGARNPTYSDTFVFDNDFPTLLPGTAPGEIDRSGLLVAAAEPGVCRVVCFSPRHNLTLAGMEVPAIRRVVDVWAGQYGELGSMPFIQGVQIFENRGAMMGASNPHPHCQIWAGGSIPNEHAIEQEAQAAWRGARGACLLCSYLALEEKLGERMVAANEGFAALVPFWAVWPFETLVISRSHATAIDQLDGPGRDALADILKRVTAKYDRVFDVPFPYSMGLHQRPSDGGEHPEWHFHLHFLPPLLRSAAVRKFLVGYEMLATPQRDITPETAAERLRAL